MDTRTHGLVSVTLNRQKGHYDVLTYYGFPATVTRARAVREAVDWEEMVDKYGPVGPPHGGMPLAKIAAHWNAVLAEIDRLEGND